LFVCGADVIGIMAGMSTEREYIRDGKVIKMVIVACIGMIFVACIVIDNVINK
jgi:hypothetical protein